MSLSKLVLTRGEQNQSDTAMAVAHRLPGRKIQYLDSQSALLLASASHTTTTDLLGYLQVSIAYSKRCLARLFLLAEWLTFNGA